MNCAGAVARPALPGRPEAGPGGPVAEDGTTLRQSTGLALGQPLIGIMWVTFGHLRPSGHIMPDHEGDRGAVLLVSAPHDRLHIKHDRWLAGCRGGGVGQVGWSMMRLILRRSMPSSRAMARWLRPASCQAHTVCSTVWCTGWHGWCTVLRYRCRLAFMACRNG